VDFSASTGRALAVREGYEEYERRTHGRPWALGELTLGLVGERRGSREAHAGA
jgi:hypothetical protein